MGPVGGILVSICILMVFLGPDDGNAIPVLIAGALGVLFIIAAIIDSFI